MREDGNFWGEKRPRNVMVSEEENELVSTEKKMKRVLK